MVSSFSQNDVLIAMISTVAGEGVDLEPVRVAFEKTKGDFRAKFSAAVHARLAPGALPEVFIELPDNPEQLPKSELEALVRPAAAGFLRSQPSKGELLDQVDRIRERQRDRPAWIPRIDRDRNPLPVPEPDTAEEDRPLVVAALGELGEVTVRIPAPDEDRPELAMAPGGIGEWESALFAVLGLVGRDSSIAIDADANEALVPEQNRWWIREAPKSVPAADDPGVASELLATSATLGGLPVADHTAESYEAVVDALADAGDWRYSTKWVLESWNPTDNEPVLTVARAAVAGWANEDCSGLVVYVFGAAMDASEGLTGQPMPLHSYVLAVTRSATDTIDSVHRLIWSCPGELWCHRGGCPDIEHLDIAALLMPIVAAAQIVDTVPDDSPYQQLYGDGDGPDYAVSVLELASSILSRTGWVELIQTTWDGGVEDILLRRGEHSLRVSYDPATRQVLLTDGRNELDLVLDMLADDGVLLGENEDTLVLDTNAATNKGWSEDVLAAAEDVLRGRIGAVSQLTSPVQLTVLGLHPHADGTIRGPAAEALADQQLTAVFESTGLLGS